MQRPFCLTSIFILSILAGCDDSSTIPFTLEGVHLKKFASCDEFNQARMATDGANRFEGIVDSMPLAEANAKGGSSSPVLGETNLQVEGVDELDMAKADGDFIYRLDGSASRLQVLRRSPVDQAKVVQTISLGDEWYSGGLFVTSSRILVVSSSGFWAWGMPVQPLQPVQPMPSPVGFLEDEASPPRVLIQAFLRSADGTLSLAEERAIDGVLSQARLIGTQMHLVINRDLGFIHSPTETSTVETFLPSTKHSGSGKTTPLCACSDVLYEPVSVDSAKIDQPVINALFGVVSLDATNLAKKPQGEWVAGNTSSLVYSSTDNLYVATGGWWRYGQTPIHQFQLATQDQSTKYIGSALIKGELLNSFSMDEFEGHLRVATLEGQETCEIDLDLGTCTYKPTESRVSILKLTGGDLKQVGDKGGLGKGEQIYAVRFMGPTAYVVTFKNTDPLYVLDVRDPKNPILTGELKIPGYSSYLHPMKDGYLLAIGKDAEVALEGTDFAWYQGVAMSIFDVRDLTAPTLAHKITIGSRGTDSEALRDHKAYRYIPQKDLIVIPIDLFTGGQGQSDYGTYDSSGFQIYRATTDKGFTFVVQTEFADGHTMSSHCRSFFDGDVLSLVGGGVLSLRSAANPETDPKTELKRVPL